MARSDDIAEIPALGRLFQLGMLYDCRKDALIPGITLWDFATLQKDLNVTPQPKTESEITASNSIEDKMSALNASASLKLSLLGGLIEVEGSARYLQDTKRSRQQARVTLQYKTTTEYKQLTMNHLGRQNVSHPDVFEHGTATHVVTAILYGAQAFFVFDRQVSSSESVQEVEGSLQAVINKVVSISGKAAIELEEKDKNQTENLSCKFHGDFALENNPVTFQDAMNVYANLPQMLGDHGEKAVPVRVWLYPLTKLDSRAAKLVREISVELIFDAEALMEHLNEVMMRCHDLARDPVASTFPEVKGKIRRFKDLCKQHRQMFQKHLAGILPSIRGGGKEERVLVDLLMSINQSPFNSQRLNEYLDIKEKEFNHVESYLKILNGMEIVSSPNKLEEIVLDPKNTSVVSFTFTSLHDQEPFLSSLQTWLQKSFEKEAPDCPRGQSPPEESKVWFEEKETTKNARRAAKAIKSFAQANQSNEGTQVLVSSVPDKDNPGASIYFYEEGELVSSSFELPSKPLPPSVGRVGHDRVQLTFKPAEYGRGNISGYQVEYRISGEENWEKANTENNEEKFLLKGLRPNKEYRFRYAARSKPGLSETSEASGMAKTLPTSPPGKPREVSVESSTISVAWDSPRVIGEGAVIQEYKVEWREEPGEGGQEGQWKEKRTKKKKELCEVDGMKPHTVYRFRISAVCVDGAQSDPSEEATISVSGEERKKRVVQRFLRESTLVEDGPPPVYALPLKLSSDASGTIYQLGEENLQAPKRVILVMGATGSGKTTLINGMANYILGVRWEDNVRFKLIHEVTKRSQAESQTSDVTAYILNHQKGFQIPYSLTIIDTPGFGDTRGIKYDKIIVEKIREFFSTPGGIDHIDAVCFVVQAALARLTSTQKYVLDSVLSIFGKDIKDNILVLVTFADGQRPPVLEAMKEADVPCVKDVSGTPVYFKFNNSALFANNEVSDVGNLNFDEMFWKMGTQSMKTFLDSSYRLETRSLILTQEVLRERKELEAAVEGLQVQIRVGLIKLEELRKTQKVLDQHKGDMAANRNFEYEVERTMAAKKDISHSGWYITNCQNCQMTCHYPCGIPNDQDKRGCVAINSQTGTCTVCPGRCPWNIHFNMKYKFEYKVVKEKKTYDDLKRKYEQASGEVMTTGKVLEKLGQECEEVKMNLQDLIESSSQRLRRLQEIALKPNPLSTPEYIDLLIKGEERELKPGYQERIQSLRDVRMMAEIIQKIERQEPLLPGEETFATRVKQWKQNIKSVLSWFK